MQEGKNSREESDKEGNNEGFDSMRATVCMYIFGPVTLPICPLEMCIILYFVSRNLLLLPTGG